ncbi:MAG: hypothetical protein Q4P34_04090 [Tissierellia bacterium]|nr:hypothetical protein [Tissierellia bacterium]
MKKLNGIDILNAQISSNRLSHAYIFESDEHEDGREAALKFIEDIDKSLNHGEIERSLNKIDISRNLKIVEPNGKTIRIEDIRDLIRFYQTLPFNSKYKYAIIFQAERLRVESSNAMLKLLEDMPEYGKIILVTKSSGNILPTIKSRCQVVKIESSKNDDIIDREFIYSLIDEFLLGNFNAIIQNLDKIDELKEHGHDFFSAVIEFINSMLLIRYYSYDNGILSTERINKYKYINISRQRLISVIEDCIEMQMNLKNNVNFLLSVEELALNLSN